MSELSPRLMTTTEMLSADSRISDSTAAKIAAGVAPATRDAYSRGWSRFTAWCGDHGRTALPATGETMAEYVAHLGDLGLSPATIEQALAAIRTAHRQSGHQGLPDTRAARLVLRAHRRECAEAGDCAVQAAPITIDALRAMVDATDPATLAGKRDRLVLVLGLAMMARRSELCALTFDDIAETDDGLEVRVRKSKTDQDARGAVVAVPRGQHSETDPIRLLAAYRAELADRGISSGRLLRSVSRHGQPGDKLSNDAVGDIVRRAAVRAGLADPERYSAHSLRAGGATIAYRAGAPVSSIAAHGRWAPASPVVLGYIRSVDRWAENPMRGAGL